MSNCKLLPRLLLGAVAGANAAVCAGSLAVTLALRAVPLWLFSLLVLSAGLAVSAAVVYRFLERLPSSTIR